MSTEEKRPTSDLILGFIARNEPSSKWQLARALTLSYGNTYATTKNLLGKKLIRVTQTRPSDRNPKIEVEYYGLTLLGFLIALSKQEIDPTNADVINTLIERQSHLHILFAKWKTLSQQIPQDELFPNLSNAVETISLLWPGRPNDKHFNQNLEEYFMENVLAPVISDEPGFAHLFSIDKWIEAARNTKELKEFVQGRVRELIKRERKTLQYHKKILKRI